MDDDRLGQSDEQQTVKTVKAGQRQLEWRWLMMHEWKGQNENHKTERMEIKTYLI